MNNQYIVGVFNDEDTLLAAIHRVKEAGIKIAEIYTPYPIHEAIEAMGKKSRFTFAAFLFGFIGAISILAFLMYTAVLDWPINYGGKPTNAFPSFIVVTLVLTILTITLASLFTFSVRAKVYPGKSFVMPDERAMDDKFIIVFELDGNLQSSNDLRNLLHESGAEEIHEKELQPLT
ncbi:MAG: DUF3341 domain-containing protein [Omnitrophica WOR_2 bacterium]